MALDPLQILYKVKRNAEFRIQQLAISVTSGNVDNMENYKYIIGQINALEVVRQDISNLLENKEHNDSKGTVVDINTKIQLPNKDLVGLKRSEEQKEVTTVKTKLPKPTGWRMLVLPFRMDEKLKAESY